MAEDPETQLTISYPGALASDEVTIWTTKIDHNADKPLINIPVPRQKADMDGETAPSTYLIDIGRVKEVITVQGILIDDATTSAQEKKTNLMKIIYYERSVTFTWGSGVRAQTYTGNINKCSITETPGIIGVQSQVDREVENTTGYRSEKNFAIQIALMVGTEK